MSKANDLTGRTFGLLKVLRRVENVKPGRPMWLCECRCGKSVVKSSTSLTKQNGVKSCGCLRHGSPVQQRSYVAIRIFWTLSTSLVEILLAHP